ncbi:MAG: hypothetical protein GEU87_19775 [Alphaproteobacteria bacterium]|nr:hypothetical protein [Alphaproteobacteria bacterium]
MVWTSLDFAPLVPLPVLIGACILGLLAVWLGFAARARGALLRAVAVAVLLLALGNPALVEEEREPLKDVAAVIVDESPSVSVADRNEAVQKALAEYEAQLARMSETLDVRVVRVKHENISEGSEGTKLIGPLQQAVRDVPAKRFAGAILLTDGQVHDVPKTADRSALPGPVHVVLAGNKQELDRRLVIVQAPPYGIVGKEVTMTVRVEDYGKQPGAVAPARPAVLTIRRDGQDLRAEDVPVGIDHSLTFMLDHGGPTVFEMSVSPIERELTLANNKAVLSVNGVRDRLRVLLVSGEPHAGERTWRNLLKSDPSVDLVHFTILRPPEKQDGTPIHELSLISFPTRELFEVKLQEFDLVIFDRYRRRGVLPPVYFQNIVDYVERGGALLSATGPTFASPFSLYRTPLQTVLPGEPTGGVVTRGYRPEVTDVGLRHPVTSALPNGPEGHNDGQAGWGRWFRQIEVVAKRGNVLMRGVDDNPLLILDRFAEGRVAQINSDHIWLWARGFEGGGPQAELLRRVAHWLMKEPELEENALRAQVKDGRLEILRRSLEDIEPKVTVTAPDGSTSEVELKNTGPGRYQAALPVTQTGLYSVSDGDQVAMAAAGTLNPLELADVRATEAPLAPVAEATQGSMHWMADGLPALRRIAPDRRTSGRNWIGLVANEDYLVTGVRRLPAMPALLVLALALGAAAVGWRREGK